VDLLYFHFPDGKTPIDEALETVAELYVADDDTVIIDEELMAGLDKDLDDFFAKLISE
jgi:aryl-alcohol dehydrogenase-like predicted oxidoreductase